MTEHAIEVVDKKMSLYGSIRRFSAIRIGIKSIHSSLRFEDQDLDSLPPRLTSLGLTQFQFNRSTESMVLPMVSKLFHDIKNKSKDDDEDKEESVSPDLCQQLAGCLVLQHEYLGHESGIMYYPRRQLILRQLKCRVIISNSAPSTVPSGHKDAAPA